MYNDEAVLWKQAPETDDNRATGFLQHAGSACRSFSFLRLLHVKDDTLLFGTPAVPVMVITASR